MSGPKNNLPDVIRRLPQGSNTSVSAEGSRDIQPKAYKFKAVKSSGAALTPNVTARNQSSASLPSFSTPGFVPAKPKFKPGPGSPKRSSTPMKRSSSDICPDSPQPKHSKVKKAKTEVRIAEKENIPSSGPSRTGSGVSTTPASPRGGYGDSWEDIGLELDRKAMAKYEEKPFHIDRIGKRREATMPVLDPPAPNKHADLNEKTNDQLQTILCANLDRQVKAVTAYAEFHSGENRDDDIYMINEYKKLVEDRISAIRAAMDARRSGVPPTRNQQGTNTGQNGDAIHGTLDRTISQSSMPVAVNHSVDGRNRSQANATIESFPKSNESFMEHAPPEKHDSYPSRHEEEEPNDDDLWESFEDINPDDIDIDFGTQDVAAPVMTAIDFTTSRAPLDNSAVSRQTIGTAQSSPTTVSRVDQTATPYYPEIIRTLKSVFKLNDFRHHQLEAINATMDGKDVFVLMPTGGGKSLCYQVPAVCHTGKTNGVTVVVSPLIALMIDQVNHLKAKKVDVVLFNSDQGLDSSREARARLLSPGRKPRLLYVTPERLHRSEDMRNILRRLYDGKELARFVVDEAHCVSTWGRDFRESYQDLDRLRVEYPKVPIMALTATANEQVMKDVIDRLRIQNCVLLKQSFNRPNLHYDVRPKQHRNVLADIAAFIKANHSGETGIIYCMSRNKCEEVARDLRDKYQLRAKHYHAQLTVEDKSRAQSAWQQGHCEIIVATIAFGMGIDKANVRFVIHHSLPKSLDGYYQETGRAGRDCEPADCVLFYTYGDTAILFKMIREGDATLEEKARQEDAIREVVRYCQNDVDCRRAQVLGYFGQAFNPRECHKSCNNCLDEAEIVEEDLTSAAKDAISLVQSLVKGGRERVTKNHCSNVFRGSMLKDVKDKGHDQQALFGAGAEMSRDRVDRLFDHLMNEQAFREEAVSNKQGWNTMYMQLCPLAQEFLSGRKPLKMRFKVEKNGKSAAGSSKVTRKDSKAQPRQTKKANTSEKRAKKKQAAVPEDYFPDEMIDLYQDDPLPEVIPPDGIEPGSPPPKTRSATGLAQDAIIVTSQGIADEQSCLRHLLVRRKKISAEMGIKEEDIMDRNTIHLLSCTQPMDKPAFDAFLLDSYGDPKVAEEKWSLFGEQFLNACIDFTLGNRSSNAEATASGSVSRLDRNGIADLHKRFEYKSSDG